MKQDEKDLIKKIRRVMLRLPIDARRLTVTAVGGTVYLRGRLNLMRTAPRGTDPHQVKQQLISSLRRIKGVKEIMDQCQAH